MLTRYVVFCLAVIVVLVLSSATHPKPKPTPIINEAFFFANNDDIIDAVPAYAEALCMQDKATERTSEAWLIAGALCVDSYRDDDGETSSNDGGWTAYRARAFDEVKALCAQHGNLDELCKLFK